MGTGKKRNALSRLLELSANLDCKEISNLSDLKDIANLNESIPTPFDDKIHSVERCHQLKPLFAKIALCIDNIASRGGILLSNKGRIGEPEFESFLKQCEAAATANERRDEIVALKYIFASPLFPMVFWLLTHTNICLKIVLFKPMCSCVNYYY